MTVPHAMIAAAASPFRLVSLMLALVALAACVRAGDPAPVVDHGRRSAGYGVAVRAVPPQPRGAPVQARQVAALQAAAPVGVHRVAAGDTVYGIARRYGATTRAIITANRLRAPYVLIVGQVLTVPAPGMHRVAARETIYDISRRYGVDMSALVRFNAMAAPYRIEPGQELALPGERIIAAPGGNIAVAQRPAAPQAMPRPKPNFLAARNADPVRTAERRRALRPIGFPPPLDGNGWFIHPVEGRIISNFGAKDDGRHNDGINIAAPRGASVRAAQAGVVAYAGSEIRGYGNLLLLKHDGGFMSAYAHAEELLVRRGDVVRRGQIIATVGNSGGAAAPQLHFEIRRGTKAVDPNTYLALLGG